MVWFLLIGFLITVYTILDGYDLGVGFLHLFARDEHERRVNISAIGPLWDGNEVWLVTEGGALFAVFPVVYATVLSAFYILFFLLMFSLILRALSIEIRNKAISEGWKRFWDWGFGIGSLSTAVLFGIMLGNILQGLPVDEGHIVAIQSLPLFNTFSVFTGILVLALFTMHGAVYLTLKADGLYLQRVKRLLFTAWVVFIILYSSAIAVTVYSLPDMFEGLVNKPLLIPLAIINLASIIYLPFANRRGQYGRAFTTSAVMIVSIMCLLGLTLFPDMLPSTINPLYNLTAYNASAGPYTLKVMLIIALIALPIITVYAVLINRVFRGKVVLQDEGYE